MPGGFSKLAPKLEGRIGDTVRATVMRAGRLVYLDLKVEAREVARSIAWPSSNAWARPS